MPHENAPHVCRLCRAPIHGADNNRWLCEVCDEYAQHLALQSNKGLERIVGELEHGPVFMAASRNAH
ncbi:MAG TPA: hypothetical protein VFL80_07340 [Thermoanaerobaculia bacterium]|nr:hypothetical protein [Thermoanaerobaculia bacterium]